MASLFYKTGRNLVGSVAYHLTNIIISQIILWLPSVTASYVLAVEIGINIALVAIIKVFPITVPKLRHKESMEVLPRDNDN